MASEGGRGRRVAKQGARRRRGALSLLYQPPGGEGTRQLDACEYHEQQCRHFHRHISEKRKFKVDFSGIATKRQRQIALKYDNEL